METIAVYWEQKIKTYGFQIKTGLSLVDISFRKDQADRWGLALKELNRNSDRFHFVLSQAMDQDVLRMLILVDQSTTERILAGPGKLTENNHMPVIQTVSPVDLIHFQGPHFGDRYGVADIAFRTLADAAVPILTGGCAGSSIYLVLSEGQGREAIAALSETFDAAS